MDAAELASTGAAPATTIAAVRPACARLQSLLFNVKEDVDAALDILRTCGWLGALGLLLLAGAGLWWLSSWIAPDFVVGLLLAVLGGSVFWGLRALSFSLHATESYSRLLGSYRASLVRTGVLLLLLDDDAYGQLVAHLTQQGPVFAYPALSRADGLVARLSEASHYLPALVAAGGRLERLTRAQALGAMFTPRLASLYSFGRAPYWLFMVMLTPLGGLGMWWAMLVALHTPVYLRSRATLQAALEVLLEA